MTTLTHDIAAIPVSRLRSGLTLALASAMSFALSGPIAKGLIESGWTAGAAVTARVLVAAAVLVIPSAIALSGRWWLVRDNLGLLVAYGVIAVAGCQLAYFNAVDRMDVGVAILIEFTSPVAVIGWLWLRHGQRPSRLTALGAAVAAAGLILVLDLISGADIDALGVAWALGAMAGAAFYWIISADEDNGLPGLVLASGGLLIGGSVLVIAAVIGVMPFATSRADVTLADAALPWWLPVLGLGVITAAAAYVLGIAATRRLGSRLAAFVGLTEAIASVVFAWLLLAETPRAIQLLGGLLILTGVVIVKLGEPKTDPPSAQALLTT